MAKKKSPVTKTANLIGLKLFVIFEQKEICVVVFLRQTRKKEHEAFFCCHDLILIDESHFQFLGSQTNANYLRLVK